MQQTESTTTGPVVETATLGGGCFWCLDAVFRELRGVRSVVSGYAGGTIDRPTYRQVCNGNTGHAEVVRIEFDTAEITYRDLLEVFFATHDPTTLNRQGADYGTQYRSVIFIHSPEQEAVARAVLAELTAEQVFTSPIVTAIQPAPPFYPAEDYHQNYYADNGEAGYCRAVISPKLTKFREKFMAMRSSDSLSRDRAESVDRDDE